MADTFTVDDRSRADRYDTAVAAVAAVNADVRNRVAKRLSGTTIPARARSLVRAAWWNQAVNRYAAPAFAGVADDSVDDVADGFGLDFDSDLRDSAGAGAAGAALGLLGQRFTTVRDRVQALHARARREGWDPDELADALSLDGDNPGVFSDATADSIGRSLATLLIEAAVVAALNSFTASSATATATKTWRTMGDNLVRSEHADANGQTVGIDEPFDIGGNDAMYPMDPSLPADLAIGCRCALEYLVEGTDTADTSNDDEAIAASAVFGYNPDQERDDKGRWVPSGDQAAGALSGIESKSLDGYKGAAYAGTQRATVPDSLAAHRGPDGKFTPERAALHERLISEALAGVPSQDTPVSYLMGGGVAGGKSNIVRDETLGIPQGKDAVQLNADYFKEGLPEYREMINAGDRGAAAYTHAESAMLANEAFDRAAANRQPVVLDGTNDISYDFVADKVATLKENGAVVKAHYVTIDPQVAVDRALVRGEKIGRFIPPSVIRKTHEGVARVLPEVMEAGLFDEVTLWDTGGRPVTKIADAQGGNVKIHDPAKWETFTALGAGRAPGTPTAAVHGSLVFGYNPDQERDDQGRWSPSGDAAADALDGWSGGPPDAGTQTALDEVRASAAPPLPAGPVGGEPSDPAFADLGSLPTSDQWSTGDPTLVAIREARGFNGKPTVVSTEEFERILDSSDGTLLYRGITPGDREGSAQAWAHEFRYGDTPHAGFGSYGNGTYASTSKNSAGAFAGKGGPGGEVIRMIAPADARTVTAGEMSKHKAEWDDNWARREAADPKNPALAAQRARESVVTQDMGRHAAALGYQAVVPNSVTDTFNIQDRSMLIVEAGAPPTTASAIGRLADAGSEPAVAPEVSQALAVGFNALPDLPVDEKIAAADSAAGAGDLSPDALEIVDTGRHVIDVGNTVDDAMQPLPLKCVLWRAADRSMFPSLNPADRVHQSYIEHGYVSATTDRSAVAVPDGGWLMAVVVPAGVPGVYAPQDRELMIRRGTSFRVVSFNNNVVKVVALAPTPPSTAVAASAAFGYNPDQERDEKGRWAPSGDAAAAMFAGQANDQGAAATALLTGPDRDSIRTATVTDSLSSHLTADGSLTPEREQLHDQIVRDATAGVPSSDHPVSYMMGGGPAAGKSSILDNPALGIPGGKDAVVVNADLIKEQLPEYGQMVANGDKTAAAYVHEESSLVSRQVAGAAVANGQPVLLDGTGDSSYDKLAGKVEQLRANGGSVVGHYVTVDPDVAVERANARAERTGRAVPETVVRGTHASVARVLPEAMEKGLFDQVTLWSTNTRTPTKIAEATGTKVTIHDQAAWDTFRGYGR